MSGIEVTGITLGVLPLLLSAARNYNKCLEPFWRYRGFPNEAQRFLKLLKIQRTIFRNHCTILLGNFINHDAAFNFLNTPCDQTPQNLKLEKELNQLLSESKEACVDTVELIINRLIDIEQECHDLVLAINNDRPSETYISWKRRVTMKLRFSVSKSRLNEHLNVLQILNENFRTLASQSLKLDEKRHLRNNAAPMKARQEVLKYDEVRKASRQVHQALRRACTTHTEHLAHTSAKVEYIISKDVYSPLVKFQMGLAAPTKQQDYISFIVDTRLEDIESSVSSHVEPEYGKPEHSLKHYLNKSADDSERRLKKSLQFDSSALPAIPSLPPVATADSLQFDGHQKRDFCERLRWCQNNIAQPQVCVGTLETASGYKISVFLPANDSQKRNQQAISLGQLISSFSKSLETPGFPLYQRVGLAKVLATAVLQYHATPWLQISWESNDVVFFTSGEPSSHQVSLEMPHFNTRINGGDEASTKGEQIVVAEARNPLLYSLGVVLFEIGCWTNAGRCSSLNQTRQLLRSGRSSGRFEMGPRYDEIVEKLIECDFGCGADLNQARLQNAVYCDVVRPLAKLESDFKALQIGS